MTTFQEWLDSGGHPQTPHEHKIAGLEAENKRLREERNLYRTALRNIVEDNPSGLRPASAAGIRSVALEALADEKPRQQLDDEGVDWSGSQTGGDDGGR